MLKSFIKKATLAKATLATVIFGVSFFTSYAQNTFPSSGRVGIGTTSPNATLEIHRGTAPFGTLIIGGTQHGSVFNNLAEENTFIRAGKNGSTVFINDIHNGNVSIAAGGGRTFIGGYLGAAPLNTAALEVGGPTNLPHSMQATILFHHHSVLAHQLRYNGGNLYLEATGNGYGTNNNPNFYVGGKIGAREVRVTTSAWPDFVFVPTYRLRPLSEVEAFIQQNGHLPEVPSAKQVEKEGLDVAKTDAMLLQKIEELTLYMIQIQKENQTLKENIQLMKNKLEALEK